jgi:excisionase family DNA binding protein
MSSSCTTERARYPRRRYISINDAAEYLGVTERTIRQMISDGRLTWIHRFGSGLK